MPEVQRRLGAALAGRYAVERELGRGGMARVFLARDERHHRPVAVKVLRPELAASVGADRFMREIEIAARLTHPHILPLHDSGEADGLLYYVMPYVEGESLRDRLEREGQLPVDEALAIAREVADALAYAHDRDIVHRDIKPENILLTAGHAVVTDFGIGRAITAAGGEGLTATGLVVGSPAYMSPEQAAGEPRLDGRSDVYSLGCVVYEMLAGEPPFTGPTAQAIMARRWTEPVPSLRRRREAVPEPVERAVARALAKAPADRYATATELAIALGGVARTPRRTSPDRRRLGLAAGGIVLLAAGIWVLRGRAPRVLPQASVIAVLPLAPSVADTELTRLGRDLVFTLSANLDGVGRIRTVDAHTILAQEDARRPSLDGGLALGRRFGAGSVVHGSLVRVGRAVRADVGLFTTDSPMALGRATVTAPADSIPALTDSLTWTLLRLVWQRGQAPSPSLDATLRTPSIPALRAFLAGERATVEGRWSDAGAAYAQAIAADSTFWLAYWRLTRARAWLFQDVEPWIIAAYRQHRSSLPLRVRLMVDAEEAESLGTRVAIASEITRRFPDYWPAWFQLGDWLVHDGPALGYDLREARQAFERAVELIPALTPAWTHLEWTYLHSSDTAASRRALETLARLGTPAGGDHSWESLTFLRVADLLLRGRAPGAATEQLAAEVVNTGESWAAISWTSALTWAGFPEAQIALSRRALALGLREPFADAHRLGMVAAWIARGAWDTALVEIDRAASRSGGMLTALDAYRVGVLGAVIAGLDSAVAGSRRFAALQSAGSRPAARAELAWLDGIWAAARGDRGAIAAARRALRSVPTSDGALDASLAAFERALDGDRRGAGTAVAQLEWRWAQSPRDEGDAHPTLHTVNRLAAARWLLAAGDTAQARRLLVWYQRVEPFTVESVLTAALAATAILELARLEAGAGRVDRAQEYYRQFLRRYDLPVPANRHLVEEAKQVASRL